MEDELLGQEVLGPPDSPSDSGRDESVLVSRHVDRHHPRDSEVPDEVRVDERRDKSSRGGVDCDERRDEESANGFLRRQRVRRLGTYRGC